MTIWGISHRETLHFPMVFLWFSYGFHRFSIGLLYVFQAGSPEICEKSTCEDLQLEATVISFGAALSAAEKARQKVMVSLKMAVIIWEKWL